jgi:Flp pilus assembly protein TadB
MAQTRKRRRRKHRGTQAGSVERRARSRPRSRAEARDRAKSQYGQRRDQPPTWRSAINRGLVAAGIFFLLIVLLFRRPIAAALALSLFMLAFYIPMGYYIDRFIYRRRQAQKQRERHG